MKMSVENIYTSMLCDTKSMTHKLFYFRFRSEPWPHGKKFLCAQLSFRPASLPVPYRGVSVARSDKRESGGGGGGGGGAIVTKNGTAEKAGLCWPINAVFCNTSGWTDQFGGPPPSFRDGFIRPKEILWGEG